MFLIAVGNPFDGVDLYGDEDGNFFEDGDEAMERAAKLFKDHDWWVVSVRRSSGDLDL